MREFVFTVEYENGADGVMDLFIEHPDLYARSMEINATGEVVWGIEKVVGPAAVLDEFDDTLERVADDPSTTGMCGAPVTEYEYTILSSNAESRKIHWLRREGNGPRSIPLVAVKHIGEGLIMRVQSGVATNTGGGCLARGQRRRFTRKSVRTFERDCRSLSNDWGRRRVCLRTVASSRPSRPNRSPPSRLQSNAGTTRNHGSNRSPRLPPTSACRVRRSNIDSTGPKHGWHSNSPPIHLTSISTWISTPRISSSFSERAWRVPRGLEYVEVNLTPIASEDVLVCQQRLELAFS